MIQHVQTHTVLVSLSLAFFAAHGCAADTGPLPEGVAGSEEALTSFWFAGSQPSTTTVIGWSTAEPPNGRPGLRMERRSANTVTVKWRDAATNEDDNRLYRRGPDGAWTLVTTFGAEAQSLYSWSRDYTDRELLPDSRYCYRMDARNSAGTQRSSLGCAYTRAENPPPAFRLQVRIKTADVPDANTDDQVVVRLNSPPGTYLPAGNETWIDYGGDDFERGSDDTYDLLPIAISALDDVTMISIRKHGTDALCIEELTFLVNENDRVATSDGVYHRYFGDTADTCLWIGDDAPSTFTVFHDELRSHPLWIAGPVRTIPLPWMVQSEIESRIETIVGDLISEMPDAYWGQFGGRAWVEAEYENDHTLSIDLDLAGDAPVLPDPEIDIDFDLEFGVESDGAGGERISIDATNMSVDVDFSWWVEVLSFVLPCGPVASVATDSGIPDCITALEDYIEDRIQAGWEPLNTTINAGSSCADDYSLEVSVDDWPKVNFECLPDPVEEPVMVESSGTFSFMSFSR